MIISRSFTFKRYSVEELERIGERIAHAQDLIAKGAAVEAVRLSSCNRQEIYAVTKDPDGFIKMIDDSIRGAVDSEKGAVYRGRAAVKHLFRVVSSIESMIVGEAQILGQVHRSEIRAGEDRTIGPILRKLFLEARKVGRLVRSDTGIGKGAVSIASVAVEVARGIFADLSVASALVIGAGRMGGLVARHLAQSGASIAILAHRNIARAESLASRVGGTVVPKANLARAIAKADIVVTATGAREHVVTKALVNDVSGRRAQKPLFLIDMANPRNIDPETATLSGVYLYDLDDFEKAASRHKTERAGEVVLAESIIRDAVVRWENIEQDFEVQQMIGRVYNSMMRQEREFKGLFPDESVRRSMRIQLRRLFHKSRTVLASEDRLVRSINAAAFEVFWSGMKGDGK